MTTVAGQEWRERAARRGQDPRWWFPEDSNTGRAGVQATAEQAKRFGVWDGHTARERRHIQQRRKT